MLDLDVFRQGGPGNLEGLHRLRVLFLLHVDEPHLYAGVVVPGVHGREPLELLEGVIEGVLLDVDLGEALPGLGVVGVGRHGLLVRLDGLVRLALNLIDQPHARIGRLEIIPERCGPLELCKGLGELLLLCIDPAEIVRDHEGRGVHLLERMECRHCLVITLQRGVEGAEIDVGVLQGRVEGDDLPVEVDRLSMPLLAGVNARKEQEGLRFIGSQFRGPPGKRGSVLDATAPDVQRGERKRELRRAGVQLVSLFIFAEGLFELSLPLQDISFYEVIIGVGLGPVLGAQSAATHFAHRRRRRSAGYAQEEQDQYESAVFHRIPFLHFPTRTSWNQNF